jgi:hypothetical protein
MLQYDRRRVHLFGRRRKEDAASADDALNGVPGPSPWYLRGTPAIQTRTHGALAWRDVKGDETCTGKVALRDVHGNGYLVLDFYCYFSPLPQQQAILWHPETPGAETPAWSFADVRFRMLDLERLQKLDVAEACGAMTRSKNPVVLAGGEISSVTVPSSLPPGMNAVTFPSEFWSFQEMLVLVHSTADGSSDFQEKMNLCIWSVQPALDRIEVFPQDWFNHGAYDFGYQWVTRVARDASTNSVIGEGVRLRKFRLDGSLRNIEAWL